MQNSKEISYVTREQVTQIHGMKLITDFNNEVNASSVNLL